MNQASLSGSGGWGWIALGVGVAGLLCFSPELRDLWDTWTTDGLRSIGMLMAPTGIVLSVYCWRDTAWQGGSWWGLALLSASAAAVKVPWGTVGYALTPLTFVNFLPIGLLLWGYVSGVVVLFGGAQAWRKASFPLALLLCVNPVPSFFTTTVDLPLQHLGALVAWTFASSIGIFVSGKFGSLWLHFAPGFGMFIAPACNGLRSAVTMAYLALVTGWFYGLSRLRHGIYLAGAVLLAFVLNSLRLCFLVVLNWLSLDVRFLHQALEREAVWIDYVLYVPIFFIAAFFLFGVPRRLISSSAE